MSFHESKLFKLSPVRKVLAEILSATIERMAEEDLHALEQRQSILFGQFAASDLKTILQTPNRTYVPVGFIDAPRVPGKHIGAIAEILIDWVVEPCTPRFCIPLPTLLETARSMLNKHPSAEPDRKRCSGMVRIVFAYLQMKMFLKKTSTGNPEEESHLNVVFYVAISDIASSVHKKTTTRTKTDASYPWQSDDVLTRFGSN